MAIKVTREQRDAIYGEVLLDSDRHRRHSSSDRQRRPRGRRADRSAHVMTSSASAISIVSAGAFCRLDSTMNGSETAEMPAENKYDGP